MTKPPRYLTNAERQHRPRTLVIRYPFWVQFRLRPPNGSTIMRWFQTQDDRQGYIDSLPTGSQIIDQGEEAPRL